MKNKYKLFLLSLTAFSILSMPVMASDETITKETNEIKEGLKKLTITKPSSLTVLDELIKKEQESRENWIKQEEEEKQKDIKMGRAFEKVFECGRVSSELLNLKRTILDNGYDKRNEVHSIIQKMENARLDKDVEGEKNYAWELQRRLHDEMANDEAGGLIKMLNVVKDNKECTVS